MNRIFEIYEDYFLIIFKYILILELYLIICFFFAYLLMLLRKLEEIIEFWFMIFKIKKIPSKMMKKML
jgi:hypothetical protein